MAKDMIILNMRLKKGNGFAGEYDNGSLIFEGEYLNGKRNGKGKEYNFNYIFEGEYKDGERNGRGREYNLGSTYEGEFLNGKKMEKEKNFFEELNEMGKVIMNLEILYMN